MHIVKSQNNSDVTIRCKSGISRHSVKVFSLKLAAPKDMFLLSDALSKFGKFPTLEEFFSQETKSLLTRYLNEAEEIVSRASNIPSVNNA